VNVRPIEADEIKSGADVKEKDCRLQQLNKENTEILTVVNG